MKGSLWIRLPPAFALGRLRDTTHEFTALVRGTTVLDLDSVAGQLGLPAPISVTALLAGLAPRPAPVADLHRRGRSGGLHGAGPGQPRQVLQSGANYRTTSSTWPWPTPRSPTGQTVEEVRAETAALMDLRAADGRRTCSSACRRRRRALRRRHPARLQRTATTGSSSWPLSSAAPASGSSRRSAGPRRRLHHRQRPHHPRPGVPP